MGKWLNKDVYKVKKFLMLTITKIYQTIKCPLLIQLHIKGFEVGLEMGKFGKKLTRNHFIADKQCIVRT